MLNFCGMPALRRGFCMPNTLQNKFTPAAPSLAGEGTIMFLNSFKKSIINQLISIGERREVRDTLTPYFRAFTGAFETDMPFTFYFEARNKPLLFVYDAAPVPVRSSRAAFIERCEMIKGRILPITNFVRELADFGYVTEIPLSFRERPSLPPDYENHWRKYRQFYRNEMDDLDFVCFAKLVPTRKLCDLLAAPGPGALAG
jgi:hypothetical protein